MTPNPASLLAAFALVTLPGCFVAYADHEPPPALNEAPFIPYAEAGCEWDPAYGDYVWWFDADADDYDGPADVVAVYADVYDDVAGAWVDGFDLYPETAITWYSAWVGSTTFLQCGFPGYSVDITAVDSFDEADVVTVYPIY